MFRLEAFEYEAGVSLTAGVRTQKYIHIYPINVGPTSKLQAPEGWYGASSMLITQKYCVLLYET
jgi:hypothetical protein